MSKSRRRSQWWRRLQDRYRLVIMNDDTLEEETSFRLTRLNIYLWLSTLFVFMFGIAMVVVLFTPVKEYLLGYTEIALKEELIQVRMKVDSLENSIKSKNNYIKNIKNIMSGKVDTSVKKKPMEDRASDTLSLTRRRSQQDSLLRAEVTQKEQYFLTEPVDEQKKTSLNQYHFFTPLKGTITNEFSWENKHLGVDIVAPVNTAIKAVMDGYIVFSDWTARAGKVIAIQHQNNMISFYKHNSELLKKTGNFVRAGDAVAIIGNTGQYSTGPHLHFELWHKGEPVNPTDYILFK